MSELTEEENKSIEEKIMKEAELDRPPFLRNVKRNIKDEEKKIADLPRTEKELDRPSLERKNPKKWEEIHGKPIPNPGVYYSADSDDETPALERNKPEKWKRITIK